MRPDPDETEKRTNEIGTILPLLETVPDIAGHTVTTDAHPAQDLPCVSAKQRRPSPILRHSVTENRAKRWRVWRTGPSRPASG